MTKQILRFPLARVGRKVQSAIPDIQTHCIGHPGRNSAAPSFDGRYYGSFGQDGENVLSTLSHFRTC